MNSKVESLSYWRRMVFLLGVFKIPLIGYVKPKVLQVDADTVKVRIRIRRRTKNHLNSMYFGALAVGADVTGGVHAFYFAETNGRKVSFAFKGMTAEFLKRAESDVTFISNDGPVVQGAIEQSIATGDRVNDEVKVRAYNSDDELVATFVMGVSVKVK